MGRGQQRHAAKNVRIPERQETGLDHLGRCYPKRNVLQNSIIRTQNMSFQNRSYEIEYRGERNCGCGQSILFYFHAGTG